jgi:hypothetical protein
MVGVGGSSPLGRTIFPGAFASLLQHIPCTDTAFAPALHDEITQAGITPGTFLLFCYSMQSCGALYVSFQARAE